jgi:hypothetical protein
MGKLIPIFLWGRYVLIIILPINLFCQTIPPPKDSAKIWKLLDFADALIEKCQFDSAILYAEHAKNQSRTNQFKRGEAYALLKLAEIYYNKSEYLQLGALDSAALNIGKYLNDTSLIARTVCRWQNLQENKIRTIGRFPIVTSLLDVTDGGNNLLVRCR